VAGELFDREVNPTHLVNITCRDYGSPALTSSRVVTVYILDENDCTPEFPVTIYDFSVIENNRIGSALLQLNVYDCDVGCNAELTYSLIALDSITAVTSSVATSVASLRIDPTNGTVMAGVVFDYETLRHMNYLIKVVDNGQPPRSATAPLRITISDSNDNAPIFARKTYDFRISENLPSGAEVGRVLALDADDFPFNRTGYRLASNYSTCCFSIDYISGRIFTLMPLDREHLSVYRFVVIAEEVDNKPTMYDVTSVTHDVTSVTYDVTSVTVSIEDVNDNFPVIIFPTDHNRTVAVHSRSRAGSFVARILASDSDVENNSRLTYTLERRHDFAAFDADVDTGWIRQRKDWSKYGVDASFRIFVRVSDGGNPSKSVTTHVIIVINDTLGVIPFSDRRDDHGLIVLSDRDLVTLVTITSLFVLTVCVVICVVCAVIRRQQCGRVQKKHRTCLSLKGVHSTMVVNDVICGSCPKSSSSQSGVWNCRKAELAKDSERQRTSVTSHLYSRSSVDQEKRDGFRDHYLDVQYHSQLGSADQCIKQVRAVVLKYLKVLRKVLFTYNNNNASHLYCAFIFIKCKTNS